MRDFNRFKFYLFYVLRKLFLPLTFEVKKPVIKLWIYELIYSFLKLFRYSYNYKWPFKENVIITKFGKFKIRRNTADAAVVSPVYERFDLDFALDVIDKCLKRKFRVLVLDVGADIGTFGISVCNAFSPCFSNFLKIVFFEPVESSFKLLEENIRLNDCKKISEVFNFALGNENRKITIGFDVRQPGSSSILDDGEGA